MILIFSRLPTPYPYLCPLPPSLGLYTPLYDGCVETPVDAFPLRAYCVRRVHFLLFGLLGVRSTVHRAASCSQTGDRGVSFSRRAA